MSEKLEPQSAKDADSTAEEASGSDGEKRRATVPHILQQQHSFEKRYSQIINRQILETSINRKALQRQVNVFFSFSRSPTHATPQTTEARDDNEAPKKPST